MAKNALRKVVDLAESADKIRLEILPGKSSLEVFVNNGEAALTTYIYPDTNADHFAAFSTNGNAMVHNIKI